MCVIFEFMISSTHTQGFIWNTNAMGHLSFDPFPQKSMGQLIVRMGHAILAVYMTKYNVFIHHEYISNDKYKVTNIMYTPYHEDNLQSTLTFHIINWF